MARCMRMCVVATILMFQMAAFAPLAPLTCGDAGGTFPQGPSSRAYDNDPGNGEPVGATRFVSGEVIFGSIMVNQSNDYVDWYLINVPAGNAVNASLYHLDFNDAAPYEHNLQLLIGRVEGQEVIWHDVSWTEKRWETVSWLSPVAQDIYVLVITNLTGDDQPNSLPTNYTLSMSFHVPTSLPWDATAYGTRDVDNSSYSDGWAKVSPRPGHGDELQIALWVPPTGDFDLYIYHVWPYDRESLLLVNASTIRGGENYDWCLVGGSEGDFYIKIDGVSGFGTFSIWVRRFGDAIDKDNSRMVAMEVGDNEPIWNRLDQGRDRYDWYQLYLEAGEGVPKVDFEIEEGRWDLYRLSFLNPSGEVVAWRFNTLNGDFPWEENPTLPTITLRDMDAMVEGFHYIVVEAYDHWPMDWEGFKPANCEYTIRFTLPNAPPVMVKELPEVVMDEDTVHSGFDLSDHFMDPDGHELRYSLGKQTVDIKVKVNEKTGEVTFTPDADWFGTEKVVFRATDTGPGSKYVEASTFVIVSPVNDPPKVVPGRWLANITMNESELGRTETLSTIFTDPDNDPNNPLTYRIELLKANMTPESATIPLPLYNKTSDTLDVGPVDLIFGEAVLRVTADDNNGSLEKELPSLLLNITIIHTNHAPEVKGGATGPITIRLVEGEVDDSRSIRDLLEDKDVAYAGDSMSFSLEGQVNVDAYIGHDGSIVFDASTSEYFPGQNYQEEIVLIAEDRFGERAEVSFDVHVTPVDDPPVFRTVVPSGDVVDILEGERAEFKVVVDDMDTFTSILNYTWYVQGVPQVDENCSFFTFETDFTSATGMDTILKVVVTDGTTEIDKVWTLRVVDVNRPPQDVSILKPLNATVFKKGKIVSFVAQGQDPDDGDELTFIWFDGGVEIGRGKTFSSKGFSAGFHTVRLDVTDGDCSISATVIFEVRKEREEEGVPGFGTLATLGAMVVATGAISFTMSRRRRWSP